MEIGDNLFNNFKLSKDLSQLSTGELCILVKPKAKNNGKYFYKKQLPL